MLTPPLFATASAVAPSFHGAFADPVRSRGAAQQGSC